MKDTQTLVSIIVLTYNSSEYVIETLDSCFSQTYKNIELIISDDCSTDNTISLCDSWLNNHRQRFVNAQILCACKNTGIVGNINRALDITKGEWIKLIAGDDLLINNAINEYINYVNETGAFFCVARNIPFSGKLEDKHFGSNRMEYSHVLFGPNVNSSSQYHMLSKVFGGNGPTFFGNRSKIIELGKYDVRFPMQEDHPFFISLTKKGYKLHFINKDLVYYRINPDSVCHKDSANQFFSPQQVRYIQVYKYQYMKENLGFFWRLCMEYSLWLQNKIIKQGNCRISRICSAMFFYYLLTDPFVNYSRLLKIKERILSRLY